MNLTSLLLMAAALSITTSASPLLAGVVGISSATNDNFTTEATTSEVALNPRSTNTGSSLPGLPSGCMQSYNGIYWGWLPDDESNGAVSISTLNADTGKKSCFFGDYSKINSASYDGSDITGKYAAADGAVFVLSAMPVGVTWKQVDTALAAKIAGAAQSVASHGLTVYLRFAHEMNCYGKPNCASPAYPGYEDYAGFKQAWINVANACRAVKGCYMMWSPNLQDLSTLSNWFPGKQYIDVIAVDHYPKSDSDVNAGFVSAYGSFYNQFVAPNGLPFMLGETAYGGSLTEKDAWVKALTMSDFGDYPLYKGAMWFEYNKEANFYVVYGQSKSQENTFDLNFK